MLGSSSLKTANTWHYLWGYRNYSCVHECVFLSDEVLNSNKSDDLSFLEAIWMIFFFFLGYDTYYNIFFYQQHIFFPYFLVLSEPLWLFRTVLLKSPVIVNECVCVYPFGLNLFFQPGLGPGFFLTLDSSGAFGLRLLFRTAPFRALGGKLKRITPELLTSAVFNDGQWKTVKPTSCLNKDQTVHHHLTSLLFYSPPNHLQRWP